MIDSIQAGRKNMTEKSLPYRECEQLPFYQSFYTILRWRDDGDRMVSLFS